MKADVWRGIAAGTLGGVIGSTVMVAFNHALAAAGVGRDDHGRRKADRRSRAEPNATDSTIPDEPASEQAASNLVEAMTGRALDDREQRIAGSIAHHAFGGMMGAAYGAAAAGIPAVTAGAGAAYGAIVWLTATEIGVPLAGLSQDPRAYPPVRHAASLASHVVFGLTVEAVRRSMTRR